MKVAQKLLLILLVTALIPLASLGLLLSTTSQRALKKEIQSSLNNTAEYQLRRLTDINTRVANQLNDVVNKAQLRLLLQSYQAKPTTATQTQLSTALSPILANEDTFHEIYIASPSGKVVASTNRAAIGQDYSKNPAFALGRKAQNTSIFFLDADNEVEQYLTGPLMLGGQLLGVAIVDATADPYLAVTQNYAELGRTGESYLTRKTPSGTTQYLTPLRFEPKAALTTVSNPSVMTSDYRHQAVIESRLGVPHTDWTLVVKIDQAEVFAPLSGQRNVVLLILGACTVLALLVSIYFAKRFTTPIVTLTQRTHELMNGNFNQRIEVHSSDEIGTLATAFNTMTTKLAESYGALEKKVVARTQELNLKLYELSAAKAKDDAIIDSIGDGLLVTDNGGYILLANAIAAELLGLDVRTAIGKRNINLYKLFDDSGQEISPERRPLQVALSTGQKATQSFTSILSDGTKRVLSFTATPVLEKGAIIGAIQTIRDVTHEREVDRMKTEFISLASHQLRTPLSAIRWFSEMLLSGDAGQLTADQSEFQHNIHDSTIRMIELVTSLLNISRIESGRIIIAPVPTDLSQLIHGIVNDLKGKTAAKSQNLIISVHQDLPEVSIDPQLIGQVYLNLLTNAIKYTPKGGDITVMISRKGDDIISQVTDNGYGIPKAEQGKLFSKFFRATNIVKVETDGTGLGMYLVKSIIESSGGRIWFESEEGKGTTFWFAIPMSGMKAKTGEVTLETKSNT